MQSFQTIFPELGHQAFPTRKPAAAAFQEPTSLMEAEHCDQFPRLLRCYTFHAEEIDPIYKGHPAQEVLSIESADHAEMLNGTSVVFINIDVNVFI